MLRFCTFFLLSWLVATCRADVLPLATLLDNSVAAPALRAVEAEMSALDALRQQREAEAGWQWFASAGVGRYRELVTEELRDDYYGRDLALGLRHPLLGSLHRQLGAVRSVDAERQQQAARRLLYQAQQRLALRSAYADWWRAQQEQRWCEGLAEGAQKARQHLAERLRGGWLLASEAGLLDGRWQALQRRCTEVRLVLDETRYSLQALSGQAVGSQDQAQAEMLADTVQPLNAWLQALEAHPRLLERREQLQLAEQNRDSPWYAGVDSNFSIAQSFEERNGGSKPGNGLVASISLSAPFDPLAYGQARDNLGAARYQAAVAQLDAEREQLAQGLAQALRTRRLATEELSASRQQLESAALAMHEQRLRRDSQIDQAFLGTLTAELEHGYAGLRLIAAWHALWLQDAALRLLVDGDQRSPLLGPLTLGWQELLPNAPRPASVESTVWRQGAYVWDSRQLLDEKSRRQALSALREAGMQRIYLGVSATQVAQPERLREGLRLTLNEAHELGLEVALLLGDPQWLLPGPRQGLLDLLTELATQPFDALHLDLEVEQLGWPVPRERLQDWVDTLAQVVRVSPWPLELSSHHRWFVARRPGEYCVPCHLQQVGVQQVSLMIYTRNPERSAELAEGIARRWPALRFRLAQSLEPQLAAEETWSGTGHVQLQAQVERWRQRLQAVSVGGIDWQDWSFYPH
ncbi:TolC family protein [Stutzerimonas stutzeri]|uniref:TolC family protein n=1 Tax=Stutzerimonas stutzeri TaxID=316 RepID=UPI00210D1480|nr:TolC family protein [Stutzerimonas stutzeri]MCQ4241299.1 TolC family protein [Stutzerimonas stutzeri]